MFLVVMSCGLGHLPVLRHDSGSTTDVMQIMEYLRKLVSFL